MMDDLRPTARLDLHMHSLRSDGRFEPAEVLRRCARGGLDVVAITDHDLGLEALHGEHELEGARLRVLAGAEISTVHQGREYHLLVYFPGEISDGFRTFCRRQCVLRARRYDAAVEALGLGIAPADEAARRGDRAVTRYHLAQQLVQGGHAHSTADAFSRFLALGHGHVPKMELALTDAIRIARENGGVTSWAHPTVQDVQHHAATLAAAGLQGIEALRPSVNRTQRSQLKGLARHLGLFLTGGSDWHGWKDPDLGLFAIELQQVRWFVDALRAAA